MTTPDSMFIPPADAAVWHVGATTPAATLAPAPAAARVAPKLAGLLLLAASIGFIAVFAWLASAFGYPDVLDLPSEKSLPALLTLGTTGRAVWVLYALLPLLLIPAVALSASVLVGPHDDVRARGVFSAALALQVVSSLAMTLGLARWSTLQWTLAEHAAMASPSEASVLYAVGDAMNRYLGNGLGEFVGELTMYGSFLALSWLLWQRSNVRLAVFGGVTAMAGWMGMFRNMTSVFDPVAEISNVLLPLYLITVGVWLMRVRPSR